MNASGGGPAKENSQTWWGRTVIGCVAALGAAWYVMEHPEWGDWTAWAKPVMVALGGLLLLTVIVVLVSATRASQRKRLADALRPKFGPEWAPTADTFRSGRIRDGVPQKVRIIYPDTMPDYDLTWRTEVQAIVAQRMGTERSRITFTSRRFPWLGRRVIKYRLDHSWDLKHGAVRFVNRPVVGIQDQVQEQKDHMADRIEKILKPSFGVGVKVTITEWESSK